MLPAALPAPHREKMSGVDTAWLRMDSPANLMMIVAVLMFERPLESGRLRQSLVERLLPYRRFRSRVVQEFGASWWQEQAVDLDRHLLRSRLPGAAPDNKAALERLVGELAATPLDPALPLWQMQLVDNCIGADGRIRQALIIRIHHCIADGIALVGVLLSLFDAAPHRASNAAPRPTLPPDPDNPWLQIMQPVTSATLKAIELSSMVWTKSLWMLADPAAMIGRLSRLGHLGARLPRDAAQLALMADDTPTRLKGKPAGIKHVAWSEPLPLAEVKAIGSALGASVNDVLMASVAGAIGSYLRDKGEVVAADCALRAMIPVNLRKAGREHRLGNAFGLVPLVLPVGLEDPLRRLQEVRRRMTELKGGYQALVAMALLGVLGSTPQQMQNEIQNYFARKATMVMSNVPGPQAPMYLAGSQLEQIMFWVPQSGDIGVGISILSYNGGVQFGIVGDDAIAADPDRIIRRFAPEFEKLVLLALLAA